MSGHPDRRIADAIDRACSTHPYYWQALGRLRIVADPSIPTMATSKDWVTHYNPETVASWTTAETAAVLVHELEHLLRQHHERCGDRDPGRFNTAADAEINERLAGLPQGAIYPETLGMPRGRTAEVYYAATSGDAAQPKPGDPGDGQPNRCGSAAGGPTQPHEAQDALQPGAGANPDVAKAIRKDAAQRIVASRTAGTEPGSDLREWAERQLGIDRAAWYAALASTVGHVMAPYGAPTRWQWPGRRDPSDMGGAMVPRWTGNRPTCAIVIDTSSSVSEFDLDMALAAGHYIARVAEATYYTCDTFPVRLGSTPPERLIGGGGTDMRRGIAAAIADGAKAVVVITDCETPWPQEPSSVPVIIGANVGAGTVPYVPDWMVCLPIVADVP